ncbi:MAG: DNA/RNA non-specific endonuclease [Pseudomonadota bacterium]
MPGYDPNFLGTPLPLPGFAPDLIERVLERDDLAEDPGTGKRLLAHYHNYTVAMHQVERTPLYAALNINQEQFRSVGRSNNWRTDSRIGDENQLNNDYYTSNPWDRGHLARRSSAAWGATGREAKLASDDTFFFSNASLQHANFNQDEWLALENWVAELDVDATDRISVFSGPIFGDHPRSITPAGRATAKIPAAFYKVVCWVNSAIELQVRAFVMAQDAEALRDKRGFRSRHTGSAGSARRLEDFQRYQVSVTEIEEQTGLIFPQNIPDENPLLFNPPGEEDQDRVAALNVDRFPERIEVDRPAEVIAPGQAREVVMDDDVDVFIAAALVNASGDERFGEWVSIINLTNAEVDLAGWRLKDPQAELAIEGSLGPGEAIQIGPLSPIALGNSGGTIGLYDDQDRRIDRVKYPRQPGELEDRPVIFAMRDMTITA